MTLIITLEARDKKEIDANLQAVKNSIFMGGLDDMEQMDGSYQINDKINIEYYDEQIQRYLIK